jgi:hypothetical protein
MPLIGSAIIPNSPLLLPKLSPAIQKKVSKTKQAVNRLADEIYALQPTVVMLLAAQAETINVCRLLQASSLPYQLAEWGDVVTRGEALIATGFTHTLKEMAEVTFPLLLSSADSLSVDFAVPVIMLQPTLPQMRYVFLSLPPKISIDDLTALAKLIADHCNLSAERILLASVGTLAEPTNKTAAEAKIYDKYFMSATSPLQAESLVNIDSQLRKKVKESLWAPTVLMSLVLQGRSTETNILSYDAATGAGYLVAQINLL